MTLPILLALSGMILIGMGFIRGMPLALIVGAFLLSDAMVAYLILGPAATLAQSLFRVS